MIMDANLYFAHFFFLNKNMYIFIWGESSIKMSEPGEYCHTHRRTHTRIRLHTQKSHSERLLEKQTPTSAWRNPAPAQERQRFAAWAGQGLSPGDGLGRQQSASTDCLVRSAFQNLAFLRRGKGGNNSTHQMGFFKPS